MHHCLTIEEILSVIFAYTDPKYDGTKLSGLYQTDFDTLRSLAVTCKTFRAPALDRLWYTQWGLENLVALLPVEQMDTGKPLKPTDWDRFDEYARRIRRLEIARNYWTGPPYRGGFFSSRCYGVFPSRAVMEIFHNRGKILLPRLKILVWDTNAVSLGFFQSFDLFLGPSAIDLALLIAPPDWLDAETSATQSEPDLTKLASLSSLQKLQVDAIGTPPLISQLRSAVTSFRYLKILQCTFSNASLPFDLLLALSMLPMLQDLFLEVYSSADEGAPMVQSISSSSSIIPTFPALRKLTLVGCSSASCTEVLRITNLPTMKSLHLEAAPRMALYDTLVDINANCSATALQELVVGGPCIYSGTEPIPFVRVDGLRLLRKFGNLTSLEIDCLIEVTDDDMKNIAPRWPQLLELRLERIKLQMTMNGILALVKGCPRLRYFMLGFHALEPADFDPEGYRNERIRSIGISNPPVEGKHQAIANRLAAVFPALETIDVRGGFLRKEWGMVQSCLPARLLRS